MSDSTPEDSNVGPHFSAKEVYAAYNASLVALISVNAEGDQGIGAAFHIGDGVFVTARHVVENKRSCHIELDEYRGQKLAPEAVKYERAQLQIEARYHPDSSKDVAVFAEPKLAHLPAIQLGGHLDDWINDQDFMLNEILVLGFPPIPLTRRNVLVASHGQINAVVDLLQVQHPHFIASVMARGGFSGGVAISEWGFALGVVTSSLLKNGAPEELGYLTILSVEPILECLAANELLPRELALMWDGLFTSNTEYFGEPEKSFAHSWIKTDRDGHRARVSFATQDEVKALENVVTNYEIEAVDVHVWEIIADYEQTERPLEQIRSTLRKMLVDKGYLPVSRPRVIDRSLESNAQFEALMNNLRSDEG